MVVDISDEEADGDGGDVKERRRKEGRRNEERWGQ